MGGLRLNLAEYLEEAKQKSGMSIESAQKIWVTDVYRKHHPVDAASIVCIQQHFENPYHKVLYLNNEHSIILKISWPEIFDLIRKHGIRYFITNSRQHLVVYDFIQSYKRPFLKLNHFKQKIEVVKNKLSGFEKWLAESGEG